MQYHIINSNNMICLKIFKNIKIINKNFFIFLYYNANFC